MAKRKITTVQEYFIKGHIGKLTAEEIAEETGLTLKAVSDFIAKYEPPKQRPDFGGKKGVAIMTEAQSMAGDESKKRAEAKPKTAHPKLRNSIFKPRPDEPSF